MKNSKNKFYVAIGFLVVVLASSIFVLWQVLFAQLDEVQSEYVEGRRSVLEIEQKTDLRNELKRELDKAGEDIDIINSAFLSEGDKLDFIQNLEELGTSTQNDYSIGNVREIADAKGEVQELEFNVKISGSFESVLRFMRQLQNQPYLINISQYSISPQGQTVNANLTFLVYFK